MIDFDVFSLIIETVLAVLALIITIFQWLGEKRAQKEEDKEKDRCEKEKEAIGHIIEESGKAKKLVETVRTFKKSLDELTSRNDNEPSAVVSMVNATLNKYESDFWEIKPNLERLYIELLENEEQFPMAHGYGRYISDLRKILNFDEVKRQRRINGYDEAISHCTAIISEVCMNRGGIYRSNELQVLGMEMEKAVRAIEPYFSHADLVDSVIFELNAKYNKMQQAEKPEDIKEQK